MNCISTKNTFYPTNQLSWKLSVNMLRVPTTTIKTKLVFKVQCESSKYFDRNNVDNQPVKLVVVHIFDSQVSFKPLFKFLVYVTIGKLQSLSTDIFYKQTSKVSQTLFNEGAYSTLKSIFHKAHNLFKFNCEITLKSIPGPNQYSQ